MTDAKEEHRLRQELQRLLAILRRHPGREHAISMLDLYEEFSGEKLPRDDDGRVYEDVATVSRHMRYLIDELINVHQIPIMSSSRGGYWIVTSKQELDEVRSEFISRGITSLQKSARLAKISLVDAVTQLALDLQDPESEINQRLKKQAGKTRKKKQVAHDFGSTILSPEARMAVVTKHMQELLDSPEKYADQINALQRQFGPKLLPRSVIGQINRQADQVRNLATATIKAADRLQSMVGKD